MAIHSWYKKYTMKKDHQLINTEASIEDPKRFQYVKAGEEVGMRISVFPDNRIYYTIFKEVDGAFYCYTHMREASGKIQPNCGGLTASWEIRTYHQSRKVKS